VKTLNGRPFKNYGDRLIVILNEDSAFEKDNFLGIDVWTQEKAKKLNEGLQFWREIGIEKVFMVIEK